MENAQFAMKTIAGGTGDYCTVRHIVVAGTQEAVGERLAGVARSEHGVEPLECADPILVATRRRWFELFYPQLLERARGVAEHFGLDPFLADREFASLPLGITFPGCSVAWLPSKRSSTGAPLLSRNFDFTTLTLAELIGGSAGPDEPALAGNPYVIETYPDSGLASVVICAFDLLSGATEGINEAGLVVALLADDESSNPEPTFDAQVGIGEHEVVRFLLETCSNVTEAAAAMRLAKHYYTFVRCHYLIGDASGRSLVWEHSPGWNQEHLVWDSDVQVVTNHLLHRHPDPSDLPAEPGNGWTYDRYRSLSRAVDDPQLLTPEDLIERHAGVRIHEPDLPVRTLWHSILDVASRELRASFYLCDDGGNERRTPYHAFSLRQPSDACRVPR